MFCTIYLNNILIYSRTRPEYTKYIYNIFARLQNAGLYKKLLKYKFIILEIKFLDLIIRRDSI